MSDCMAQHECHYYCSNRNKCKASKNYSSCPQEMPSRDTLEQNVRYMEQHPPPPPSGDGDWELQYCSWSGWTWVKKSNTSTETPKQNQQQPVTKFSEKPSILKKSETEQIEKKKKNSGGGFWCFGRNKSDSSSSSSKEEASTSSSKVGQSQSSHKQSEQNTSKGTSSEDFEECCYCAMANPCCCCCCNQMCCPCMAQVCCCGVNAQPQQTCKECKTIETQTFKEVKEQATKMSEMSVPKKQMSYGKKRCMCRCRPVCCPCRRNTCCPCVQKMCCSENVQTNSCPVSKCQPEDCPTKDSKCQNNIVNYCLQSNIPRPKKNDFLKVKSTNFSTLHKSLDILLKNNINIMNLFDDTKEIRNDFKPLSAYASNQTISCLSSDNLVKKADPEHSKILTAVCDAILSSHKFDDQRLTHCEVKDSGHSLNIYSSRSFLHKILSDLNFTKANKSNNSFNVSKEIGVQVESFSPRRVEICQPKRSLTKLVRNKSRILKTARFPKKVETLRKNIEMLKIGSHDVKSSRRSSIENRIKERGKLQENKRFNFGGEGKLSLTEIFKSPNEQSAINKLKTSFDYTAPQTSKEDPFKIENIESLLNSIEYLNGSANYKEKEKNRPDFFSQNRKSIHLLDLTSPPFTDADELLKLGEEKLEIDGNEMNGS